jgi:hypothetical protein
MLADTDAKIAAATASLEREGTVKAGATKTRRNGEVCHRGPAERRTVWLKWEDVNFDEAEIKNSPLRSRSGRGPAEDSSL